MFHRQEYHALKLEELEKKCQEILADDELNFNLKQIQVHSFTWSKAQLEISYALSEKQTTMARCSIMLRKCFFTCKKAEKESLNLFITTPLFQTFKAIRNLLEQLVNDMPVDGNEKTIQFRKDLISNFDKINTEFVTYCDSEPSSSHSLTCRRR